MILSRLGIIGARIIIRYDYDDSQSDRSKHESLLIYSRLTTAALFRLSPGPPALGKIERLSIHPQRQTRNEQTEPRAAYRRLEGLGARVSNVHLPPANLVPKETRDFVVSRLLVQAPDLRMD